MSKWIVLEIKCSHHLCSIGYEGKHLRYSLSNKPQKVHSLMSQYSRPSILVFLQVSEEEDVSILHTLQYNNKQHKLVINLATILEGNLERHNT